VLQTHGELSEQQPAATAEKGSQGSLVPHSGHHDQEVQPFIWRLCNDSTDTATLRALQWPVR